MLTEKATGAQAAVDEATTALEKLQVDRTTKEEELAELDKEKKVLIKQIKDVESRLKVEIISFCLSHCFEDLTGSTLL